jgi:hypothetical protein
MLIEDWATKRSIEIPDESTAFPHRDVTCHILLSGESDDPTLEDMISEWYRKESEKLIAKSGFGEEKVYVSYAQGDERQEALYGARKLEKLRKLKREWDPQEIFSWNNPIIIQRLL